MLGAFSPLKSLVSISQTVTDNYVFVLHYKVTVLILLVCTMMISCKQHFGEPITCLADNADVKFARAIDSYCWVHATYTVNELLDSKNGHKVLRPGVGPHSKLTTQKIHRYYQWVAFWLLFQAWSFYFPRFLWKLWEGGRMKRLTLNLQNELNFRESELISRRKALANYLIRNFHRQNSYAVRYFLCELLNLVNVGIQILLTDAFLGHEFSHYGLDVLSFLYEGNASTRIDPMDKIFPKLSKCIFSQFGPGGNIVPYDLLCVLPLNVLNEKIFVFLWFWFLILSCVTLLGVFYRILTIVLVPLRRYRLESQASLCDEMDIKIISKHSYFGDWLVLNRLCKNLDPLIYADLLKDIATKLKKGNLNSIKWKELHRQDSDTTISHASHHRFDQEPLYDSVPV